MPWQPQRRDRTKTLGLVLLVHAALGAALLQGLAGEPLRRVSDALVTFNVPPPALPPPPPPPAPAKEAAPRESGATDLEAKPAPVVRPEPAVRLPVPPPLPSATEASPRTGIDNDAGAGDRVGEGRGGGAGGSGTGGGGTGGTGAGSAGGAVSAARLLSGNLSRGDYRRIRGFGAPRGQAVLAIEVSAQGRVSRCLPFASSGNPALDEELCRLLARTRWEPARDRDGNPVAVALRYVATWDRN